MKTSTLFAILIFAIFVNKLSAQAPEWGWARTSKGSNADYTGGVNADANGNVYLTGSFESAGNVIFGNDTLTTSQVGSLFLVKYNSQGQVLWTRGAGQNSIAGNTKVQTDKSGNVYLSGNFNSDSVTFGNITLRNSGHGWNEIFIAKYDSSGNVLWAKGMGGDYDDFAQGLAVDKDGSSCLMVLSRSSSFIVESDTILNPSILIIKCDTHGSRTWIKSVMADNATDFPYGICTDKNNNVFLTGNYQSHKIIAGSDTLVNSDSSNVFLIKYNSYGDVIWTKSFGGSGDMSYVNICTDSSGHLFLAGGFSGTLMSLDSFSVLNSGRSFTTDIYVAMLDTTGKALWLNGAGGDYYDNATGVKSDDNGFIYLTGFFNSTSITFGHTAPLINDNSLGIDDIFIVKYNVLGAAIWRKSTGQPGAGDIPAIDADKTGRCYLAGTFKDSSFVLGKDTLTNTGQQNVFIAQIDTSNIISVVSIDIPNVNANVIIYPNPSESGRFYFRGVQSDYTIEVYDILGHLITAVNGSESFLDLSRKAKGVYLYKMTDQKKLIQQGKLVLE